MLFSLLVSFLFSFVCVCVLLFVAVVAVVVVVIVVVFLPTFFLTDNHIHITTASIIIIISGSHYIHVIEELNILWACTYVHKYFIDVR